MSTKKFSRTVIHFNLGRSMACGIRSGQGTEYLLSVTCKRCIRTKATIIGECLASLVTRILRQNYIGKDCK